MIKKILLFSILWVSSMLCIFSYSQKIEKHIALEWSYRPSVEDEKERIYFLGATYESKFGNFPLYRYTFSENKSVNSGIITIKNPVFIPMDQNLEFLLTEEDKNILSDTLFYTTQNMPELRRSNLVFTLLPFRKNRETGEIERLYCADVEVIFSEDTHLLKNEISYTFPSRSPFADGTWYKVKVNKTGVFKITGKDLKDMGMDIVSINPKNLKVCGMRGGMLPEMNGEIPNTGIQEQSIYVYGEDDGALSETDYILFYGESPNSWSYNVNSATYKHSYNIYDDYNYYFISATSSQGKRIQSINNNSLTENITTGQSDYNLFHEQDLTNLIQAGKTWVGETFTSSNKVHSFTIEIPNAITSEKFFFTSAVASSSKSKPPTFTYQVNETDVMRISMATSGDNFSYKSDNQYFTAPSASFTLKMTFTSSETSSEGFLDYFEIQARRNLVYNGTQMGFRDKKTFGEGKITKFNIQNATPQTIVWDVTEFHDVKEMALTSESNGQSFKSKTDTLLEFIAFDVNNCEKPAFVEKIENQNVLGQRKLQSIIISHPDFVEEAKRIEEEHRGTLGLKTLLITPDKIYNEFSSGRQDVSAIRDFMKMLYLTSGDSTVFYLLLIGDVSCDYKNKQGQTSFMPIWANTGVESGGLKHLNSIITDDFYALLDVGEGGMDTQCIGLHDIAVGRFPVKTVSEMQGVVNKRLHYTSGKPETFGQWRNIIAFISDDPDSNGQSDTFSESCEWHESIIMPIFPEAVIEKIYSDSYTRVISSGGTRYPVANKALTSRVDQGVLILDYVGHGSKTRWSEESLLEIEELSNWKNYNHLPFVITETCSYAPFDDLKMTTTAGETMFLLSTGGAIAMFVSTRETYNGSNNVLTNYLYTAMIPSKDNNYQAQTIGASSMIAKRSYMNENTQNFSLFGDPALTLLFPKEKVVCTAINNQDVVTTIDTISALTVASFKGEVRNIDQSLKTDFNGYVYPTVFDKEIATRTLGQVNESTILEYKMWKNIIFKGSAKVKNGKFSFDFFVPKDIDYTYDFAKVVFYASDENAQIDANGVFSNFVVGGFNADADGDTTPPEMRLYMNDTLFVSGGYTNQNPILLALLFDENGINATGSSIGHNITAILDGDVNNEMVLNNFYETEEDNYKKGVVTFPLYNLSEGEHSITVRAWDSYNNSVKGTIKFVVVGSKDFIVRNLYTYPNPFSTTTNFVFEHNASDETLDITIHIFDLTGRFVREIRKSVYATGYRIPPIPWNGDSNGGALLTGGYYVYQMTVKNSTGGTVKKSGKVVITR